MAFVKRDKDGDIIAVSKIPEEGFTELLEDDEQAVTSFLVGIGGSESSLQASDLDMIRVVEDVVELLIEKGVILFTEMPEEAQHKILRRQQLRARSSDLQNLIGDD